MVEAGVLYHLTGNAHALNLAVSLHSLRKVYDGPVAVVAGCPAARKVVRLLGRDARLRPLQRVDLSFGEHRHFNKILVARSSPFESTVMLDADTLPVGPIDRLFAPRKTLHVTRWADFKSNQRPPHSSLDGWRDVARDDVDVMLTGAYSAINAGVMAFHRTRFLDAWHKLALRKGEEYSDEISAQLTYYRFRHRVFSDAWNCSPVYSTRQWPVIWHGHGNTFLHTRRGREVWSPLLEEVLQGNVGNARKIYPLVPNERRPRWSS